MAKSIAWPEFNWASISLAEGKMPQAGNMPQAETADSCSKSLAVHHQEKPQHLVISMSMGSTWVMWGTTYKKCCGSDTIQLIWM